MVDVESQEHTRNLINFLTLFSNTFTPPKGGCWNLFQHSTKITSKICSQLLLKTSKVGILASTTRERVKFFNARCSWLGAYFPTIRPDLHGIPTRSQLDLLVAYGSYVRCGGVSGRKHQVRAQTVALVFRANSIMLQLDRKRNPLVDAQGKY